MSFQSLSENAQKGVRSIAVGRLGFGTLEMGMMWELFQALGTLPSFKDKLKSIVTAGAVLYAVYLSILVDQDIIWAI